MSKEIVLKRPWNKAITHAHDRLVFRRRLVRLAEAIMSLLPPSAHTALDVGSGSGEISRHIAQHISGVDIQGVDVFVRSETAIHTQHFDGEHLPFEDHSIDVLFLIDVIHHVTKPDVLLRECARVAKQAVIIKDHYQHHALDRMILRFMDWAGNESRGVDCIYRYYNETEWDQTFKKAGLSPEKYLTQLNLYPFPASLIFERHLHFIASLKPL